MDALAGGQRAARDHPAVDILPGGADDFQLQVAVAQEHGVAGLDVFSETRVSDRDFLPGAEDRPRGQRERRAGFQRDRSRCHLADPDLQPGEILKDGDRPTHALGDAANRRDDLEVLGRGAVREVQPRDVHSGPNQLLQGPGRPRRGADGAHGLRSRHGVIDRPMERT